MITDTEWLQGDFISTVQKRGAAIIEARGLSSAASAASAAIDTVVSLRTKTAPGDCVSVAVASNGEYGVPEGLQFGFPIIADGEGGWSVAEGLPTTSSPRTASPPPPRSCWASGPTCRAWA